MCVKSLNYRKKDQQFLKMDVSNLNSSVPIPILHTLCLTTYTKQKNNAFSNKLTALIINKPIYNIIIDTILKYTRLYMDRYIVILHINIRVRLPSIYDY